MNSSQSALLVSGVSILLSAVVLATAQRRVLARPEPRATAYVVAWLVTVALLGGLRSASDYMVGNASLSRLFFNVGWIAAASAFSLFVGDRVVRGARRAGGTGAPRPLLLFMLHAVVMALVSYI